MVCFVLLCTASRDDHDVAADNAYRNGSENPVQGVTYANRKCNGVQVRHLNQRTWEQQAGQRKTVEVLLLLNLALGVPVQSLSFQVHHDLCFLHAL